MKKILFPLLVILFVACKTQEPKVDYSSLSGEILNHNDEEVYLNSFDKKYPIQLIGNSFSDSLKIEDGYYQLYVGFKKINLYLEKGENLHLTVDIKNIDSSLSLNGSLTSENEVLAKISSIRNNSRVNMMVFFQREETEFFEKFNQQTQDVKDLLQKKSLSLTFNQQQLRNNQYYIAKELLAYESYHGYFTNQHDFKTSLGFDTLKQEVSLELEEDFKNSLDYREYLKFTFKGAEEAISKKNKENSSRSANIIQASNIFKNPFIKEHSLRLYLDYLLNTDETLDKAYQFLIDNTSNEAFKEEYTIRYETLKKLTKGMPSPQFTGYKNYNGGTTSFTDFKGKYVYMDIWATWCSPCIREFPHLKAIEKEFRNKNIEFVSISIDKQEDHAKWIDMIKNQNLSGIQLLADNEWDTKFIKEYRINGVPRFILIDPEGDIISAEAPRPSDPKLKELFTTLNI